MICTSKVGHENRRQLGQLIEFDQDNISGNSMNEIETRQNVVNQTSTFDKSGLSMTIVNSAPIDMDRAHKQTIEKYFTG